MKAKEFLEKNYSLTLGFPLPERTTLKMSALEYLMEDYVNDETKELIEKIEDLEEQLNDDGEIPFVDIPVKTTKYKLTEIKKK